MQRTHRLVGIVLRCSQWGLPWFGVLALSASFAYAMNVAVGGGPSAQDAQLGEPVTPGPAELSPIMVFVGDDYAGFACFDAAGGRWLPTAGGRCDITSQEPTIDLITTRVSAEPTLTPRPDSAW